MTPENSIDQPTDGSPEKKRAIPRGESVTENGITENDSLEESVIEEKKATPEESKKPEWHRAWIEPGYVSSGYRAGH